VLADWLLRGAHYVPDDIFRAPSVRPALVGAWLAGFALYQWMEPVGPAWWTSLIAHTHPGTVHIGGSLPSFGAAFLLTLALSSVRSFRPALQSR
jgi:hypothetical protein